MNGHQTPSLQRVITIRTPENIELRYALAGAGSRASAYVIDLLLMLFVGQLLINLIAYLLTFLMQLLSVASELWAGAVAALLGFLVYNGYFIFFEWLLNGQTPGKRLLHIRVIKEGGYALRFLDTLVRNLLRVIDFIPLFYGVGLASLLLSRHCQRLGDIAAGTLVVHESPVTTDSLLPNIPESPTLDSMLPAAQVAAIPVAVLSLTSEFLIRRTDLSARTRQEIGGDIVNLIHRTSGLAPGSMQSMDRFLASVVKQAEQIAPSTTGAHWQA
jgi:uncharacterized RDD family membrane protein YckC